ncbi:MAG: helix-turn-helix domain-containing protein [Frankiaceae bacterium]
MDARAIGARVAELRRRKGWTQQQLARALPLSDSYVSMIESGTRTASQRVIDLLAQQLDCSVTYLRTGLGPDGSTLSLELEQSFAELALRSGDTAAALERFVEVEREARAVGRADIAAEALYGAALAREVTGDLDAAVDGFQQLADDPALPASVSRVAVLMMLCRTSMDVGELTRAVEVGETALREHRASGAETTEKTIELVATVVYCYYQRGDLARARNLIEWAITEAERLGSPRARASAYWNAALVAHGRGQLHDARRLTDRALAIYGELDNRRALAMLRRNMAWLMLDEDERSHTEARPLLERALAELVELGSPGDAAEAQADLARCHLAAGETAEAVTTAREAADRAASGPLLESAKVRAVLADALLEAGHEEEAVATYRAAAEDLTRIGAARHAAAVWRQLGAALHSLGRADEAVATYECMAEVTGIAAPTRKRQRASAVAAATQSGDRAGVAAVSGESRRGGRRTHDRQGSQGAEHDSSKTSHRDESPSSPSAPLRLIPSGHASDHSQYDQCHGDTVSLN